MGSSGSKQNGGDDMSIENNTEFAGVPHLTDADFDFGVDKEGNVVATIKKNEKKRYGFVALYAGWCGYCKRLSPQWTEYSKEFRDYSFGFYAVDLTERTSENQRIMNTLKVRSYPTIAFIDEHTGVVQKLEGFDRSHEGIQRFLRKKKLIK